MFALARHYCQIFAFLSVPPHPAKPPQPLNCVFSTAFDQGISEIYSLTILVDGDIVVEDWISGAAQGFETVSLVGVSGESVTIVANLEDGEIVDIAEVRRGSL